MELPKITNSLKHNVFGPLKFNNRFSNQDSKVLKNLQNDNIFFKQKLAEFEVRLDNITQEKQSFDLGSSNSKFNRFNNAKLREKPSEKNDFEVPALSRRESTCLNIPSARLNTGRSSILTARTAKTTESVSKIDDILDNIKKHRRSAVRRNAFEKSQEFSMENKKLRPKTSANLPLMSKKSPELKSPELEEFASRVATGKKSGKKSRAKTARDEKKKDDEYCHMFYSRSWRIHPELGIIKDKDRTTYDNTQTNFYHTTKQPPETFIFAPDWV